MDRDNSEQMRSHLAEALHEESGAGFPRLRQIPSTAVIQFLDFLSDLQPARRDTFIAQQAQWWAAIHLQRSAARPEALEELGRISNAPGPLVGGPRYTAARDFRHVPLLFGSRERWLQQYAGRQLQIRDDLIPDIDLMVPAKAPLLRKVLSDSMREHGFSKHKHFDGVGFLSPDRYFVSCDFGGPGAQFRYDVLLDVVDPRTPLSGHQLYSYERLWGIHGRGWDLLSEENAARCMELVAGLVETTARIVRAALGEVR
jgi:hypothetical protein